MLPENNFGLPPPFPVLHYLLRVTASKNLQKFTKPAPQLSPQRIWGRNALFVWCHSRKWSASSSLAHTMADNEPSPLLCAVQQHKGIYTCRQISFFHLQRVNRRGWMWIAPFCSTHQPGSPTQSIWGEELVLQQRAVLNLHCRWCELAAVFALRDSHSHSHESVLAPHRDSVPPTKNEVAHRDCTSFTSSFVYFTSLEIAWNFRF